MGLLQSAKGGLSFWAVGIVTAIIMAIIYLIFFILLGNMDKVIVGVGLITLGLIQFFITGYIYNMFCAWSTA